MPRKKMNPTKKTNSSEEATPVAENTPDVETLQELKDTTVPEEPKKKRGRHPKGCTCGRCAQSKPAAPETPAPVIPDAVIRAVIALPYQILAGKRGPQWLLSDLELETMIPVHRELAMQYLPDYIQEKSALYSCFILHGMHIFAAVDAERRLKEKLASLQQEEMSNVESQDIPRSSRFGQVIPDASGVSGGE